MIFPKDTVNGANQPLKSLGQSGGHYHGQALQLMTQARERTQIKVGAPRFIRHMVRFVAFEKGYFADA